jgi:hypothetical protein
MEVHGKFIIMTLQEFEGYIHGLSIDGLRKINHVQTHHTWSPSYRNFNGKNYMDKLTSMEADHIARGFGQIAQHYTTFPDGMIATGRPLSSIPTCIHGHNTGGICIENLGNFDTGGDTMSGSQRETIVGLNALLLLKFSLKVSTDTLVYHHWFRQSDGFRDNGLDKADLADHKTCPGTNFFGGNTVKAATTHFLPEIQAAYIRYGTVPKPQPVIIPTGEVNAEILNVRKGPGADFEVVDKLARHTKVNVLETNGDWDRIGDNRWVKADYIALTS